MEKGHSEEFFGGYRDFWWNDDFLELMARRWDLEKCESVLDVGCGLGHWSMQLFKILATPARITGVDLDPKWVKEAAVRFKDLGMANRFHVVQGSAEKLPFPDNSFDMVTCQTVLIHLTNVPNALKEMKRVLKPGGLIVVVEPNNISSTLFSDSLSSERPIEDVLEEVRFELTCERGKIALGRGNSSVGDLLPGLIARHEFEDIKVYLSDKSLPMFPPYLSDEQQALKKQFSDWQNADVIIENRMLSLNSYLAAGGKKEEFERHWEKGRVALIKLKEAIESFHYSRAGGAIMYLVSGRKRSE
jgi:SAM-dependent methyltransferase